MVYVRRALKLAWCIWHGAYSEVLLFLRLTLGNGLHRLQPPWIIHGVCSRMGLHLETCILRIMRYHPKKTGGNYCRPWVIIYRVFVGSTRAVFYEGEERLQAGRENLGDDVVYFADGVVRAPEFSNLEIMLLETSNALDACTDRKKAVDFHKEFYGAVAMLKTIADTHKAADLDLFTNLKVYFMHVSSKFYGDVALVVLKMCDVDLQV